MALRADGAFYRQWILANGWAEALGLGTTFVVGTAVAPWLEGESSRAMVLLGAAVAVLMGTCLEGVVVGIAQERVLRPRMPSLPPRAWVVATAIGAGLAWVIGMVPSTVMALAPAAPGATLPAEPPVWAQYALAAILGLVVGPVLGFAQWTVLRRHVRHAVRWLWANAVAWAAGMALIFVGMDRVPWTGNATARTLALYAVCAIAGLAVGAIHGRVLMGLLACAHDR